MCVLCTHSVYAVFVQMSVKYGSLVSSRLVKIVIRGSETNANCVCVCVFSQKVVIIVCVVLVLLAIIALIIGLSVGLKRA